MGFESKHDAFQAAAAQAQAVHDRASPADAGNAFVAEILSGSEPLRTFVPPVLDDGKSEELEVEFATAASNDRQPSLFDVIAFAMCRRQEAEARAAAAAAAQQAQDDAADEASDTYIVAQRLSLMTASMDQFADELEMEGLGMVADFVRSAANKTRKGARLAREIARDTLEVEVAAA